MFDPWSPASSVLREKVVEHLFLAELSRHLLMDRRRAFEILRAEFDAFGYDVVVEAEGIVRHVQLKAGRLGGKRTEVDINVSLASKPGGCVVWIMVDPDTLEPGPFHWFGGEPGLPLPDLGDRPVKHSKGNTSGEKTIRPLLRQIRKTSFRKMNSMSELATAMFGTNPYAERAALLAHIREAVSNTPIDQREHEWVRMVAKGSFSAIPEGTGWEDSAGLAHLVDGYVLVGTPTPDDAGIFVAGMKSARTADGRWTGTASELWATLFHEHRRFRHYGFGPEPDEEAGLDLLVADLRRAMITIAA